jgi:hypothetical protein
MNAYLHTGCNTITVLLVVTLQPLDGSDSHLAGQVRILSIVFIVPDKKEGEHKAWFSRVAVRSQIF